MISVESGRFTEWRSHHPGRVRLFRFGSGVEFWVNSRWWSISWR